MRKDAGHDDYDLFFVELPTDLDPLSDLSTDIHDEHDTPSAYDEIQGLSAEQVSHIARDLLQNEPMNPARSTTDPTEDGLFAEDSRAEEK